MLPFHCPEFGIGLFLSPAATTSVVGVVIATLQLSKYTVVRSRLEAEVTLGSIAVEQEF